MDVFSWHDVKVGPGPQGPGTLDAAPPSKIKSGTQEHSKVGT